MPFRYICIAHNKRTRGPFSPVPERIPGRCARNRILQQFARNPLANDLGFQATATEEERHESPGWMARQQRADAARFLLSVEPGPAVAAWGFRRPDRSCLLRDSPRAHAPGTKAPGCAISLDVRVLRRVHSGLRSDTCDGHADA